MKLIRLVFSFDGRVGRALFAGGNALIYALLFGLTGLFVFLWPAPETPPEILGNFVLPSFFALFVWSKFALAAKRYHDVGVSGWYSLLLLIPFVGLLVFIYLLFAQGQQRDNDYGLRVDLPSKQ
jgi:uncharacterized membrane protein YhaH (DUF805 family)